MSDNIHAGFAAPAWRSLADFDRTPPNLPKAKPLVTNYDIEFEMKWDESPQIVMLEKCDVEIWEEFFLFPLGVRGSVLRKRITDTPVTLIANELET